MDNNGFSLGAREQLQGVEEGNRARLPWHLRPEILEALERAYPGENIREQLDEFSLTYPI